MITSAGWVGGLGRAWRDQSRNGARGLYIINPSNDPGRVRIGRRRVIRGALLASARGGALVIGHDAWVGYGASIARGFRLARGRWWDFVRW